MGVDWGFWVVFLSAVAMGVAAGWYLRGVLEDVRGADRARLMRELEQAKTRHPAYKQGVGWDRG